MRAHKYEKKKRIIFNFIVVSLTLMNYFLKREKRKTKKQVAWIVKWVDFCFVLFCWIRYYVSIWMVRPGWWNRALSRLASLPLLMDFMIARRKIMLFTWACEWYLAVVVFYLLQILFLFIFRFFFSSFFLTLFLARSSVRLFSLDSILRIAHCDRSWSFVVACIYMCKLIVYT